MYIVKSNFFKYLQIKWLKENNNLLIDCEIFSIYDILNKKTGWVLRWIIEKHLPKYYGKAFFVLKSTVSAIDCNTYLID